MVNHQKVSAKIGCNLKKIRLQMKLSQMEISLITKLSRSYIGRIETRKARVTLGLLYMLVKGLKITSSDLIDE